MTSTLLDHLRSIFTASASSELARVLGEAAAPTQKALDGLMPAITAGVINLASDQQGATKLYQLLKDTPFATDPTITELVGTGDHRQKAAASGNALLKQLFVDQPHRLAESTASYSGVGLGSATTLSGLVMSVLMGFLHQQVTRRNLTQAPLTALLLGESDTVRGAIPAALAGGLGWLIGTSRPAASVPLRTEPIPPVRTDDRDRPGGSGYYWPWRC